MVSIIILAYKNNHLTQYCLKSIIENTSTDYEIILVDNNSNFLPPVKLREKIKIIRNPDNPGFARGSNQGATKAKGNLLLFLNNDTFVTPGWLTNMVQVIGKKQDIGIVGNLLLFPENGLIQHAGIVFINQLPGHDHYQKDPASHPVVHQEREMSAVTGACLLIKKEIFKEVGGFDTTFINSYEDVDLCLKVREKGYRIIYTPDSIVYHYGSKAPGRHKYDFRNLRLLISKWGNSDLLH